MNPIQKSQDNTKYSRINLIYKKLLNTAEGCTIADLSKELSVSTKTIQRDLYEVLSEFGAVKEGRYWKINPKIANDNLGANERIILGILDEMAKNGGKEFYGKAHNLLSQVTQQLDHPIFANLDSEMLEQSHIEMFEKLEIAIKQKKQIDIQYSKNTFHLKPLKLVFFDGFWYLLALDIDAKEQFKKFHLKSIQSTAITDNTFEVTTDLEERLKKANSVWFNLDTPFIVTLLLDKTIVKYFQRKPLRGQTITGEDKDGSVEITIEITNEMEILPLVFWYIPYMRVLEPQWLADRVKARIGEYYQSI